MFANNLPLFFGIGMHEKCQDGLPTTFAEATAVKAIVPAVATSGWCLRQAASCPPKFGKHLDHGERRRIASRFGKDGLPAVASARKRRLVELNGIEPSTS